MSRPLWYIKNSLVKDFDKWVAECPFTRQPAGTEDVFEFLIQKGLLKGKHFNDYIDTLPPLRFPDYIEIGSLQPLREGYIPPRTWFGRREKKKEEKPAETTEAMENAAAKVVNGEKISETESAKLDLVFAMVLAEENRCPIVIKYDTAERIRKILQRLQEQEG